MALVACAIGNLLLSVKRDLMSVLIPLNIPESFNTTDHKTVLSCLREVAVSTNTLK